MKPAPFEYFAPESLDELLSLLQQYGDDAKILAGGQSLGPLLNMRLALPAVVLDVNRVSALDFQQTSSDGWHVGALTRQSRLEDNDGLAQQQPLIAAVIPYIGHRAIRNRGTVGGSLAHADPAAEWPGLAVTLEAKLSIQRAGSPERHISAEQFFVGPMMTALAPEELITQVKIPAWKPGTGWAILEFCQRHRDFAVVGVLVRMSMFGQQINEVAITLLGAGPTPIRARRAERLLMGEAATEAAFAAAAHEAGQEIEPDGDVHASADYRRHLANVLVGRALQQARQRATGGSE